MAKAEGASIYIDAQALRKLLARRYRININKLKRKRHDDIGKNQRN